MGERTMKIQILDNEHINVVKDLFIDVYSNAPWYDEWKGEEQVLQYLHELIDNKNSLSLVLYDDSDRLVGVSLGYIFSWWQGREYYIKEFYISREMQNQGLGSQFLERIYEHLKQNEIESIILSTQKDVPAFQFYHKNGFAEIKNNAFLYRNIT